MIQKTKKAALARFMLTGWRGFLFLWKCGGCQGASTDFWTLKNGKIYMGNRIGTGFVVLKATTFFEDFIIMV